MQVSRTDKNPTSVSLSVHAVQAELEPIKKHVLRHFISSVKVPGFRLGKAPPALVEKHLDQRAFADEFLEHAINELYRRAVTQENLKPIGQPRVQLKKFVPFTDLEFEVEQDIIGPVKLADYKNIKLPMPTVAVEAKEVNELLQSLRRRSAKRTPVVRAAKTGDEAVIDFTGTDESGKPVPGVESKDYPLILGGNAFIPGFEEKLLGAKAGESREFELTFPADYRVSGLQGKKVNFSVQIKSVNELKEPKLDDKFAAGVGPFKSLRELKADIKKQLTAEKRGQARTAYENQLVAEIAGKSQLQVPESLVDEQILFMEEEEKRNLVYQGVTWQEHLAAEGISEQQHRERNRQLAQERVKAGLVLSEIANLEKLEVSPQELDIRLQVLKAQYSDPAMQAELNKPANRNDIANRLLTEKTVAKLVDYASR